MNPDAGRINHLHLAVMGGDYGVHEPVPDARLSPAIEPVVDRCRRAVSLRQIGQGEPDRSTQISVQDPPVVDARNAARLS